MTPQARAQAAIELLDEIIAAATGQGAAADTLIARYFKVRRYAGSKDRRAIRDLVYAAIRRSGERPVSGRAALLGLAREQSDLLPLFDGSPHGPMPVIAGEPGADRSVVPEWLLGKMTKVVAPADLPALLERAPLDLRVNRLKNDRETVLAGLPDAVASLHVADGIRLPEGLQIEPLEIWANGTVEVQDEGSQLAACASRAKTGMTVVDLCAGAGGKSLAMAAMMENRGRIIACDVDRSRLSRLSPRAERAGVRIIESRLLDPGREIEGMADLRETSDIVFVDAPCSGSGTWRRNPEARWRLTTDRLDRLAALQARLMDVASTLVRPGGALIYVVCSLLDDEGMHQIDQFLAAHPGWSVSSPELPIGQPVGSGVILSPARDGTDGFFIARLKAPC